MAAAHATCVFAERHIAKVMRAVLDGPVPTPDVEQAPRRGAEHGQAADSVCDLPRDVVAAPYRAFHAADLVHARPVEEVVTASGGRQTACLSAVAVLGVLDRLARL